MLILQGGSAFSPFRTQALRTQFGNLGLGLSSLKTNYVYFVLGSFSSSAEICELLGAQSVVFGDGWIVLPRAGTTSPWSSKATEIARNCGLNSVDRIERGVHYTFEGQVSHSKQPLLRSLLSDPMLEDLLTDLPDVTFFTPKEAAPLGIIELGEDPIKALDIANLRYGLALSYDEMEYLAAAYKALDRSPTDVELMMFAQANSEHCRHKIFNASWTVDGVDQDKTLFQWIRYTHEVSPEGVLSAYADNAAVVEGPLVSRFLVNPLTHSYGFKKEIVHLVTKVETHNHPTAVSPNPGAATGAGGEIRDEGATGRGAKPKAGLSGFSVNYLRIPSFPMPWENVLPMPNRLASSLQIMLEGPIGGASFNNEFGRPNLNGYFRAYEGTEQTSTGVRRRGYVKPIMIAGGIGSITEGQVKKLAFSEGTPLIVLGGPAFLIGLGGGAASSVGDGTSGSEFDYASVQRANPEMERRCQEVIDRCWSRGDENPILFIHDVGAGGLSNALPELVKDGGVGADFLMDKIPSADLSLSPLELWCNEAQERYVLAIDRSQLHEFESICERERCPFAVVGTALDYPNLLVSKSDAPISPVDLPIDVLFGKPPKMHRDVHAISVKTTPMNFSEITFSELVHRVLSHPTVASKSFLITIGDRTVSGLVHRDQMVGPWQVPVADCAVTHTAIGSKTGEAMAMGERAPLALIDAAASARMAIAETLMNLSGAAIGDISRIKLSANWMCAAGTDGEDERLYSAVSAIGGTFCPELGVCIPVGKDSMSMKTRWSDGQGTHEVISPMSLICSGFAPVSDVEKTRTPMLCGGDTVLIVIDLGAQRMAGSIVGEVTCQQGDVVPDIRPKLLSACFTFLQSLIAKDCLLAYHDRSDGGLIATVAEMLFASRRGLVANTPTDIDPVDFWFNEEIGCVIQVSTEKKVSVLNGCLEHGLAAHVLGFPDDSDGLHIHQNQVLVFKDTREKLQASWSKVSNAMARMRDNPECVDQESEAFRLNTAGLAGVKVPAMPQVPVSKRFLTKRPRVAILREQGVNGQIEMAYAFDHCGFEAVDVHMSDLISGRQHLATFDALAACGGFSYGDVLGAGSGWARSILFNSHLSAMFREFFDRENTVSLGICNGCQMMAQLAPLIPGAEHFRPLEQNLSQQFEARLTLVSVPESRSVLLNHLHGTRFPIAVAHGEGRFPHIEEEVSCLRDSKLLSLVYSNAEGISETRYPGNPNGSVGGLAGLTSEDGRVTIMMPHPERVVLRSQLSYSPEAKSAVTPWMGLFDNAWRFVMER
jgi:phosphoribosylformylglycinamidine synthase|tara:strand:- start:21585 stop:25415 length:3831 start_codon:yes stop_codon:yes gene_type:complete